MRLLFLNPFCGSTVGGKLLSADSKEFFIFGCKVGVTAHTFVTFYESLVHNI